MSGHSLPLSSRSAAPSATHHHPIAQSSRGPPPCPPDSRLPLDPDDRHDGKEDAMSGQMLKQGVKAMPAEDHTRGNLEKQLNLTEVLAEAVKCAQALKTDELIADTTVKEAFAQLMNKVYPRLPESLQDQLLVDFKLNILRRAQEKNTPPVELMDGEQKKNFLGKKGTRTNSLWMIEKLVLFVGVCCFMYLMSLVTGY